MIHPSCILTYVPTNNHDRKKWSCACAHVGDEDVDYLGDIFGTGCPNFGKNNFSGTADSKEDRFHCAKCKISLCIDCCLRLTADPMERLAQLTAEEKLTKHIIVVEVLNKTVCFILDNPIN